MYHIVINFKSFNLASFTKTGRQSSSVPLNLLNVKLSSKLIYILPDSTQLCPERLALLSDGCHVNVVCGVPLCLLNGGVCRHVPADPALFGLRFNVFQGIFIYRWVVSVGLSHAPERDECLGWHTAVLAWNCKAGKAVEITKFLWKREKKCFFLKRQCKKSTGHCKNSLIFSPHYYWMSQTFQTQVWLKMLQQVVQCDQRTHNIHICFFILLVFDWNSRMNLWTTGNPRDVLRQIHMCQQGCRQKPVAAVYTGVGGFIAEDYPICTDNVERVGQLPHAWAL